MAADNLKQQETMLKIVCFWKKASASASLWHSSSRDGSAGSFITSSNSSCQVENVSHKSSWKEARRMWNSRQMWSDDYAFLFSAAMITSMTKSFSCCGLLKDELRGVLWRYHTVLLWLPIWANNAFYVWKRKMALSSVIISHAGMFKLFQITFPYGIQDVNEI